MIKKFKKILSVLTSIATVFTISTGPVFAATVKTDTNSTSIATKSLATAPLSISNITSNAVPQSNGIRTLAAGNALIVWITASGGSGSYEYQLVVEHQNQKGAGSGTVESRTEYDNSTSRIIYTPKDVGYYLIVVNVRDKNTGVVVGTIYMPSTTSPYIDVEKEN